MFNGPLWYCLALLLLLLLAPLVFYLRRFRYGPITVLMTALIGSFLALYLEEWLPHLPYVDWFARFIQYWFAYFLGAYMALRHPDVAIREGYSSKISIVAALLTSGLVLYVAFCGMPTDKTLLWVLCRIIPIIAWMAIPVSHFTKKPAECIRISFFVYALHYPFIIATMHMLLLPVLRSLPLSGVPAVLLHLLLITALYGICLGVVWLLKRILPAKCFAALSGGRI